MLYEMKEQLPGLKSKLEELRKAERCEDAWANLPRTIFWQIIESDWRNSYELLTKAMIAKEATEIQMRTDAAEARVYSKLLARPKAAEFALRDIRTQIKEAEAEIRRLEGFTKGV